MNQRSTRSVAVFWATLLWFFGLVPTTCHATVGFANPTSNLLLDTTNARLFINNPTKITGWTNRSIVKSFGDVVSSSWPEAYASNTIVAQTGGTLPARTNLVECNSNAIGNLGVGPRTTSNLLLYVARTYSSSLFVLRSRADNNDANVRATSNAVNGLYQKMAVPVADAIDGTLFAKYVTNHYVFHNGAWNARGWVRFNNGFTVMPLGSVIMDTLTTVSGGFDLRDTGTLILNNDLYLAHNVTLTNGGNIKGQASSSGQANTIFMGGDLTLASTTYARTLHITGDWSNSGTSGNLIIDGCGHTLNIGDRAQIFVDTNVTLTLRNMTIKTGPKSLNNPAIQLASHGSKLALDNVMFDLDADFHFITGQIFVHNEVAVTGTSAFVYQSPKPSYIASGATWSFEQATTFSVAPSTFTDCPFTVNNTYTNNAFLVLADASSALSLNGCSFQTTFTGLRLRSGMVLFDNKVAIDTTAGVDLNNTTPVTLEGSASIDSGADILAWSPDSQFIAVTNNSTNRLRLFSFKGGNPVQLNAVTTGTQPGAIAYSPDSRFIALVDNYGASSFLQIYKSNGKSSPTLLSTVASTGNPKSLRWSPDGRFLAIAGDQLQLFRFNGGNAPISLGTKNTVLYPTGVVWTPDGRFLAVVGGNTALIELFRFNGTTMPTSLGTTGAGSSPNGLAISPDGRFTATGSFNGGNLYTYRITGAGAPVQTGTPGNISNPADVDWSPDGRFVAFINSGGLYIYRFNGITLSLINTVGPGGTLYSVRWSPDGRFIAITNVTGSLYVYRCNYVYSSQAPQSFSNGLLFGDKAKGVNFDANVQILGGAVVKVKGKIRDDSV